jgi:predicted porin
MKQPTKRGPTLLTCLCALAPLAVQAQVPAQVQIYGTVDLAVGQINTQPPGAPNAAIVKVKGVHSGAMQTSYWGLRGSEDLGGGLRARFVLESFMRVDTGVNGRFDASPTSGADAYWSREAFVALGGDFGEVRMGNNGNPTWVALIQSSAMGGNSVFSPGFRQLFNGGSRGRSEVDTSMVNSIKYQSPTLAGWSANVAVQAGEGSGTGASHSLQVAYRSGPLFLTLAESQIRHAAVPNLPGVRHQDVTLIGGSWDFGVAKVFGQWVRIKNTRLDSRDSVPHVGLTVPAGAGVFQLAYGDDKIRSNVSLASASTAHRKTTSGGYVYSLSKRSDLYGFLMRDKLPVVGNADSYVLGIRHQF